MKPDELRAVAMDQLQRYLEETHAELAALARRRFPEYRRLLEALTSLMDSRGRSGYPPPHSLELSAGEWLALIARGGFPGLTRL